jgi:branched-chain amino acid transport system permease protein
MATLAAQVIITQAFLYAWPEVLGGALGISMAPPSIGGFVFASPERTYYLVVAVALVMTAAAKNIARTRTGRAFVAVRDNDLAAELMGIAVFRTKLAAFFVGCFFAGIAGALWAGFTWSARADQFPFIQSIWYLGIIIIGGMGSTVGPIFGVVTVRLLNEAVLHLTPWIGGMVPAEMAGPVGVGTGLVAFGLLVILFLIFEPRGIAHTWEIVKARVRNWPFVYPPG